jgi:glycosyltransferase involved in cell wall biosynthesis
MRIAIDVSSIIQPSAGVGVYTKKIVSELIKTYKDDQFVLFYTSAKVIDVSNLPLGKNVELKNLGWPSKLFNFLQIVFAWPKIDKLVPADVILFPNLQMWRWRPQAKVLMTVHDLSFAIMPWAFSLKMRLWHYFVNPKKNLPLTQKIISVSNATKNDLISLFGIEQDKIATIYHGVDVNLPENEKEFSVIKNKYAIPEQFLLFIGTLEPRKNLRLLIDAINVSSQKYPLVIVGRLGWLKKSDFEMIINNPRVKWLGALSDAERDVLINHCQALVWPSLYEGFGLPPLEAVY